MWTWQGGGGVCQMSILLHKPYLVKLSTKGEGGSKMPKILSTWFMDDPKFAYGSVVDGTGEPVAQQRFPIEIETQTAIFIL